MGRIHSPLLLFGSIFTPATQIPFPSRVTAVIRKRTRQPPSNLALPAISLKIIPQIEETSNYQRCHRSCQSTVGSLLPPCVWPNQRNMFYVVPKKVPDVAMLRRSATVHQFTFPLLVRLDTLPIVVKAFACLIYCSLT